MASIVTSFAKIVNFQTLIVTGFAIGSTFICKKYHLEVEFPLTLIGIAIVFPIVFSINSAYKRRETALNFYGELKAHGRALYFASRDWIDKDTSEKQTEVKVQLLHTLLSLRNLFIEDINNQNEKEKEVYRQLSELSKIVNSYRDIGIGSSEVSRCNQYLSKMILAFEKMKHIYQYRTPRTLRAYSTIFIYLLPILYGPYFAHLIVEPDPTLTENVVNTPSWVIYTMPVLFSVILVSLDNIQDHLENPFDLLGEDDMVINAEKFVERLEL